LLYQYSERGAPTASEHVYLAGSLIATRNRPLASATATVNYQHTDALGSPVAVTNEQGQVIERHDYEPYGAMIGKPQYTGIGYTGHVMDGATGLMYMQQRYYDQSVGRFLSVDPVAADASSGTNFNRYKYAANNPYRFIDPDGRLDRESRQELIEMRQFQAARNAEELEKLSLVITASFSAMAYSADSLELGGKDFSVLGQRCKSPLTAVFYVKLGA
jgi:RHS repeat-associated protein